MSCTCDEAVEAPDNKDQLLVQEAEIGAEGEEHQSSASLCAWFFGQVCVSGMTRHSYNYVKVWQKKKGLLQMSLCLLRAIHELETYLSLNPLCKHNC